MSYIGRQPQIGNFQICDAISTVNNQAAYTMQVGSVNVIPQSANHMIVSLNGTIQKPNSSFTVSGAVITFSSNLVTNDVIDFIQILGDVLDLGVPSDATVTTAKLASTSVTAAKLNNDIISGTTALTSEPADTDEFLVSDAGTLKRIDYSLIKGGGITMADNWRLSADDATDAAETDLDTNWERVDATGHGTIGSAMTQSSGVFSFPVTGLYLIQFQLYQVASGGDSYGQGFIKHMDQANNTTKLANVVGTHFQNKWLSLYMSTLFDCQNLTNDRIQFFGGSGVNGQVIAGDTGMNRTSATFIRLGDT